MSGLRGSGRDADPPAWAPTGRERGPSAGAHTARRVAVILRQRGMSAAETARRGRLSASTVGYWLRGDHGISWQALERVARVLGTTAKALCAPVGCLACLDCPWPGFTCNECGAKAEPLVQEPQP